MQPPFPTKRAQGALTMITEILCTYTMRNFRDHACPHVGSRRLWGDERVRATAPPLCHNGPSRSRRRLRGIEKALPRAFSIPHLQKGGRGAHTKQPRGLM